MAASPSASSESQHSHSTSGDTWEVAEILAERETFEGASELLVVWKCCWTSPSLVREGPVLDNWRAVTKLKTKGRMRVKLPVIAGTQLHRDYVKVVHHRATSKRQRESRQEDSLDSVSPPRAPRKQLGTAALRR
jgi:hypothetical protein